jgi:PIN domain nuclease of toxin-antitoxin system
MEQYVVDTHTLLWYVAADDRIGAQARTIIERAEAGEVNIIVPAIVLIEAIEVIRKGKVFYNVDELLQEINQRTNFIVKNLDFDIITLYKNYLPSLKLESHDKIIVITAQYFENIPIITKDEHIRQVYSPTIW